MSERQERWFQSLREGLERETGRSLSAWTELARGCPETKTRARLKWLKDQYGLGQSRGMLILEHAFPREGLGWDDPEGLIAALWKDPGKRSVFDALRAAAEALDGTAMGARKGFVGFSRKVQFLAARPTRDGVRFGLALSPDVDRRLGPAKRSDGWSERLTAGGLLSEVREVDASLRKLIKLSWQNA
jgi:hypothetical protein